MPKYGIFTSKYIYSLLTFVKYGEYALIWITLLIAPLMRNPTFTPSQVFPSMSIPGLALYHECKVNFIYALTSLRQLYCALNPVQYKVNWSILLIL